jgi:hypothetical protein
VAGAGEIKAFYDLEEQKALPWRVASGMEGSDEHGSEGMGRGGLYIGACRTARPARPPLARALDAVWHLDVTSWSIGAGFDARAARHLADLIDGPARFEKASDLLLPVAPGSFD